MLKDLAKPILYRRRFRSYCIGAPKTGTHSVSRMFAASYRASHEPRPSAVVQRLLEEGPEVRRSVELERWLKSRDRGLWLELEASHFLHYFVESLAAIWSDARFVLTMRDPYTWLNSEINQNLRGPTHGVWFDLRELRYASRRHQFTAGDGVLKGFGLYPVRSYLSYWREHNEMVLESVPPARLLVVRTDRIGAVASEMARFVGADPRKLDLTRAHEFARPVRQLNILHQLPHDFLDGAVSDLCGDLMSRWFPDISSVEDLKSEPAAPGA